MVENQKGSLPIFVVGMIVGAQILGFLLLILSSDENWAWILKHEALSAGILGVIAASVTAIFLLWQIRQNYNFTSYGGKLR